MAARSNGLAEQGAGPDTPDSHNESPAEDVGFATLGSDTEPDSSPAEVITDQDQTQTETANSGEPMQLGARVLVHPDTEHQRHGVVVEDFADCAGYSVDIGETHIADPARRWAVVLEAGDLVFVDSDQLKVVESQPTADDS